MMERAPLVASVQNLDRIVFCCRSVLAWQPFLIDMDAQPVKRSCEIVCVAGAQAKHNVAFIEALAAERSCERSLFV